MIPIDSVKISNSANGKARVVTITGINIRLDIQEIRISTVRRFFEPVQDTTDIGNELTGLVDFPAYERQLVANNDQQHQCNPTNGISCYYMQIGTTQIADPSGSTHDDGQGNQIPNMIDVPLMGWKDATGVIVPSPIGLFSFFKPLLDQPIALMDVMKQNVLAEDQVYKTWDK